MYVNHKLKMDLTGPAAMAKIDMVQRDQYVRQITLELYSGADPWVVPEYVHPIVCYQKADGTGGEYDALPDGRLAWTAEENRLTLEIAPQVLTCAGPVRMAVDLLYGDAKLSTFTVMLYVQKAVPLGLESGDYFKLEGFLSIPKNAQAGQLLRVRDVSDAGLVTGLEGYDLEDAVEEALLQARETGAFDGKSAYEIAVDQGYEGTEEQWLASLKGEGISAALGDIAQINVTGQLTTDANILVNFNNSRLRGVRTPVEDTDGVNKAYVDQMAEDSAAAVMPEYWQTAVEEAVAAVKSAQKEGGRSAMSFAWFSDMHTIAGSGRYTGSLAAAVMKRCGIPFAVLTGDAAEWTLTEEDWSASLETASEVLKPLEQRLLQAEGASDGAYGENQDQYPAQASVYEALFRTQELDGRRVFGPDGTYFYVDYVPAKIRMVVLNTCCTREADSVFGYGNEQLNWFIDQALHFEEEGWAVALFSHLPPQSSLLVDGDLLLCILYSFLENTNFSETRGTEGSYDYAAVSCNFYNAITGDVIGYFSGASHADSKTKLDQHFWSVCILSDGIIAEAQTQRAEGTQTEHALDFVTVNRDTRTVKLTRLGEGASRSYQY